MINIFISKDFKEYELLDTGEGEKLERFGPYSFIRPYENAVWKKTLKNEWKNADGKFYSSKKGEKAGWKIKREIPKKWEMSYGEIKFYASPTAFRHLSFFPEQSAHWDLIQSSIQNAVQKKSRNIKFLNLFGYTGVASLVALQAGAEVTHVDASKQSLTLAKENQKLSGLEDKPMRVIEEDVLKFLEREERRGNKYDCVIMDPPKFGKGPKGEIWKIEEKLNTLLERVRKVLSDKPIFIILTSYSTDSSSLSLGYALSDVMKDLKGEVIGGELCVKEKTKGRFISLANTAVWQNKEI